ncbi:hypothetical protein EV193_107244 [Herbihabitans rhizosphaerae]|uniref:Uncharacterized protein n=1 Tax=Herbihabitans rhizosphaerae TaxID=1872711 RepID=A0A4V2ES72_9PSEU|nr:hypothetical protein [Herbihabitans rhizosphaerae]RZS36563.1 hypothetical protein EV193_107244 [Herbihabitans rhizosphaerae]
MDTNSYLAFLLIGVVLVVIDGLIIYRSGQRYLSGPDGEDGTSASLARMVTVLFHLAVLGVLALISTIDVPADSAAEAIVLRLGIVLLVLAAAHAITIGAFTRMRDRREAERISRERAAHERGNRHPEPVVTPVPGQASSAQPAVAPPIERGRYSGTS